MRIISEDQKHSVAIAYGRDLDPEFLAKVKEICEELGWKCTADEPRDNPLNWLIACMAFESAKTFSPSVKNAAGSGATGLIQFMPRTAKDLGTTTAKLAKMTAVDQMDYVKKYFKPYAKRIKTLSDMYMAILMPKFVGQPEDTVIFEDGVAYRQNAVLDKDKDGQVTKAETTKYLTAALNVGLHPRHVLQVEDS